MTRPLVLDLCAGVGGAARGFRRLGFDVLGLDIGPSEKYPGRCVRADVRDGLPAVVREEIEERGLAFVWASPTCHPYTTLPQGDDPDVIAETVAAVQAARELAEGRVPAAVENVPGARDELAAAVPWPEAWTITLSGEVERFDLGVRKRRLVACSFPATTPPRERVESFPFSVSQREEPAAEYRRALGFRTDDPHGVLTTPELREAIPPCYVAEVVRQAAGHELVAVPGRAEA